MVTEQEAREAAERLDAEYKKIRLLSEDDDQYRGVSYEIERHEQFLLRFALQELSRRDAERAEREKPITAEWLESLGCEDEGAWLWVKGFNVRVGKRRSDVWCGVQPMSSITTRGQLLDLLAALKGGAT